MDKRSISGLSLFPYISPCLLFAFLLIGFSARLLFSLHVCFFFFFSFVLFLPFAPPRAKVRVTTGSWKDAGHPLCDLPNTSRRFALGASNVCLETRRAPSRHSRDARVYGHTTTAMHKLSALPPPPSPLPSLPPRNRHQRVQRFDRKNTQTQDAQAASAPPAAAAAAASPKTTTTDAEAAATRKRRQRSGCSDGGPGDRATLSGGTWEGDFAE